MDDYPKPLRIVKSPTYIVNQTRSESYPGIPARSSSMGDNSNMFPEYAPGTPTPAPRAGAMGTLNVRKTRQPDERSSGATMSSEHGIHESPISNIRRPSEASSSRVISNEGDQPETRSGRFKRLFWPADSRGRKPSTETHGSSSLQMGLEATKTNTSRTPSGDKISAWQNRNSPFEGRSALGPLSIPVPLISLEPVPKTPEIGVEEVFIESYVRVEVDLPRLENPKQLPRPACLDIIYIMDNTSSTPQVKENELCDLVFKWVSMLNMARVRFAVGCVNDSPDGGLKYILPMSKHVRQQAKNEIDKFPNYRLSPRKQEGLMLRKAVSEASHDLLSGDGEALGHIVLVSFEAPDPFPMPKIDRRIGFHTLTPRTRFKFANHVPPFGWHIQMDVCENHIPYIQKVEHVMSHLYTGINPGAISNLTIKIDAADGCIIETSASDIRHDRLRPGEVWTFPVWVTIPAASAMQMLSHQMPHQHMPTGNNENLSMDELFSHVQQMVSTPVSRKQCIYTVLLEYQYSVLPGRRVLQSADCKIEDIFTEQQEPHGHHSTQDITYGDPGAPLNASGHDAFLNASGPGARLNATGALDIAGGPLNTASVFNTTGAPLNVASARLGYGSMQDLRGAAGGPHETPHHSYSDPSVLHQFPFNQGQPSPMAPGAHSQPRGPSFRDRVHRSQENMRARFRLFSDKQKHQGGFREDPVPEESDREDFI